MIGACFFAMLIQGQPEVYLLPNCDPKLSGKITCEVVKQEKFSRHMALCVMTDTRKFAFYGPAYKQENT